MAQHNFDSYLSPIYNLFKPTKWRCPKGKDDQLHYLVNFKNQHG